MKKIILSGIIITTLSVLFVKCSQDTGPVDSNDPVVDPISRTWTNVADSFYTIFFETFDSTVARGVFWGIETNPNFGDTELCGFFDGTYVEFDVRRPFDGRTKFKGKFINNDRIELESSEGSLVITR